MDPRPYHYEYRRPRLDNPTYQSVNMYESVCHKGLLNRYENDLEIGTFRPKNQFQRQIYQHSVMVKKRGQGQIEQPALQVDHLENLNHGAMSRSMMLNSVNDSCYKRPESNRLNLSNQANFKQQRSSVLASYGRNTIPHQKGLQNITIPNQDLKMFQNLNQFSIYQKQQNSYNIIGNIPRLVSKSLREYPKFTLEDKLIEKGKYLLK